MKKYRVYYSEHAMHEKVFEAESSKEAMTKARKELEESCWDTGSWDTGNGEGGQFDVEELSDED